MHARARPPSPAPAPVRARPLPLGPASPPNVVVSSPEAAIKRILVVEVWCATFKIHKFRV